MIVDELIFAFEFKGGEKVKKALKSVGVEIKDAEKRYKELEDTAKKTGGALDRAAAESQRRVVASLKAQQREIEATIDRQKKLRESVRALGRTTTSAASSISNAADRGFRLAFGAAVVGAGAATVAVNQLADRADRVKNTAAALGLTTDQFQELEFAANQTRLTTEQFQNGMRQMAANLRLVSTSAGKGEAAGAIKQLGLNWQELVSLSPDQQLLKIADAAQAYGNSAQRNAALARIFGEESGAKFAELLNDGAAGITNLTQKAREFGVVLGTEALNAADDVADSLTDMKAAISGAVFAAAQELLPIAKEMAVTIREWAVQNRALIRERVREWIDKLRRTAMALRPTAEALGSWVANMVEWFSKLNPETVKFTAELALLTVGIAKTVPLITGLVTGFKTLQTVLTGLAPAAAANPILAIASALAIALPLALQLGDALGDVISKAPESAPRGMGRTPTERIINIRGAGGVSALAQGLSPEQLIETITALRGRQEGLNQQPIRRRLSTGQVVDDRIATRQESELINRKLLILNKELEAAKERRYWENEQEQFSRDQQAFELQQQQRKAALDAQKLAQKPDDVSDVELAKLIQEAASSGLNLDQALKGRRIAGNAPPVITVTVNNETTNVGGVEISVNAPDGTSAREVAAMTKQHFEAMFNETLRTNSRSGPRAAL